MVKKSIVLMSAFVLGVTLGSEADAVKKITTASWGPMDEFVTVLPPYKWSRNNLVANSFRDKEDMRLNWIN